MGRGPARPMEVLEDGPWPGLANQFFGGRAAARPDPSIVSEDRLRPCPAHRILNQIGPARPGPSILQICRPSPTNGIRSEAHETRVSNGPARGFEEPAHGPAHQLAHVFPRTKKYTLMFFLYIFVLIIIG